VIVEILNILANDDLRALGATSPAYLHLLAEAMGHGFADRARWYGDPEFTPVPIERLTSPAYGKELRDRIQPETTLPQDRYGTAPDAGTTHLSVIDAEGTAVACTTTINTAFGAMLVGGSTGVLLNNEMDDFSAKPGSPNMFGLVGGSANAIAPGKRMLSSMTPTIVVKDGRTWLVLGSPGGGRIITTVLQVLLNVVDHGMDVQEAVDAPRFHHQWLPDAVLLERRGFSADVVDALEAMGHTVRVGPDSGDVPLLAIDPSSGLRLGAADPRQDGVTVGY
jgi:gamma-glutamyltranspeptidase / glutathione hydrolase